MSEPSVYVIERDAWSIVKQCYGHFFLTYEREFLTAQNLWRDFLIHSEEAIAKEAPGTLDGSRVWTINLDEAYVDEHGEPR